MIGFDTFTKLPKNGGDLGKLIVAKGFKNWPKVQYIAQSGHTDPYASVTNEIDVYFLQEQFF